jgi:hypothetical protein
MRTRATVINAELTAMVVRVAPARACECDYSGDTMSYWELPHVGARDDRDRLSISLVCAVVASSPRGVHGAARPRPRTTSPATAGGAVLRGPARAWGGGRPVVGGRRALRGTGACRVERGERTGLQVSSGAHPRSSTTQGQASRSRTAVLLLAAEPAVHTTGITRPACSSR